MKKFHNILNILCDDIRVRIDLPYHHNLLLSSVFKIGKNLLISLIIAITKIINSKNSNNFYNVSTFKAFESFKIK